MSEQVSYGPRNPAAFGDAPAAMAAPAHPMPAEAAAGMGGTAGNPAEPHGNQPTEAKPKTPRKAHLRLSRVEPWSVMKFSFMMSLVCFVILFVAVLLLYGILAGLGVFDALSATVVELTNDQGSGGKGTLNPAGWFSAVRVLGSTALIGALNVLLITALSTVGAVIYNSVADIVGGVEVTLTEAE